MTLSDLEWLREICNDTKPLCDSWAFYLIQRFFTKRLTGLCSLSCDERLTVLGLERLELRRIYAAIISCIVYRESEAEVTNNKKLRSRYTVILTFPLMLSLSSLIVIVHEGIHWNCCILMRELTLVLIHFLYVLSHFGIDSLLLLYLKRQSGISIFLMHISVRCSDLCSRECFTVV